MSKLNNTPIKPFLFVHRTRKLYTIAAGIVVWTLLTTLLTVAAINSKYFHNTYQCEAIQVQPIKILDQQTDQKQSKLISRISTLYNIPKHRAYEIVNIVDAYTKHHSFPDTKTVLAVIATESRFNQHATSSVGAKGLMQVLQSSGKPVSYELYTNIQSGVELLREYHNQLGSHDASLMAYNVGIGAYQAGKRPQEYLNKVKTNLRLLDSA